MPTSEAPRWVWNMACTIRPKRVLANTNQLAASMTTTTTQNVISSRVMTVLNAKKNCSSKGRGIFVISEPYSRRTSPRTAYPMAMAIIARPRCGPLMIGQMKARCRR